MSKIKLIALCGKAGSGKDTIMHEAIRFNPNLNEIISCTTRPPREGEVEGKNYYFLSEYDFLNKVKDGEMLEWTNFNNWFYGTALFSCDPNKINIGVFSPKAIRTLLLRKDCNLFVVWVRTSDKERLLRQLNREDNPDVKEIVRRATTDYEDFDSINFKYFEIKNETTKDLLMAPKAIMS